MFMLTFTLMATVEILAFSYYAVTLRNIIYRPQ